MERLYKHIENVLRDVDAENSIKDIGYQRYREDIPNSVGIILIDSRNDEIDISGETEWEAIKIEIHLISENSETEIFKNMDLIRKFVDKFEELDTNDGLELISAEHLGAKCKPSYVNSYGYQVLKCTLDINYSLTN